MSTAEKYLKPEVINQIKRLDLRAQFIVKGFLHGLHASPFHGFSVEFSEHRKYVAGDDPKDIDWLVFAKTDKYYVKKFEAETNITGYLVMDLSRSMGYTYRQELTKFDYSICLAAALCYLMIHQQDPVGLITFDKNIRHCLRPKTRRGHLGDVLSLLANSKPEGETNIAHSLVQVAAMLRHTSLVMIFSDLLADPGPVMDSLYGMVELEDPENRNRLSLDADSFRKDYINEVESFREHYRRECYQAGIDYIGLDTSMQFDRALTEYLVNRAARG
jgi:uncharacterized protein (DUF58 family)